MTINDRDRIRRCFFECAVRLVEPPGARPLVLPPLPVPRTAAVTIAKCAALLRASDGEIRFVPQGTDDDAIQLVRELGQVITQLVAIRRRIVVRSASDLTGFKPVINQRAYRELMHITDPAPPYLQRDCEIAARFWFGTPKSTLARDYKRSRARIDQVLDRILPVVVGPGHWPIRPLKPTPVSPPALFSVRR